MVQRPGPRQAPRTPSGAARAPLPAATWGRGHLSHNGIAVGRARPHVAAFYARVEKIYSGDSRNRCVTGITFEVSATHSRRATGKDAELVKEDEIPQRSEIDTSPTRREVIAADAHHSGDPLAARRRAAYADDGRRKN